MSRDRAPEGDYALMLPYLPADSAEQSCARDCAIAAIRDAFARLGRPPTVLDVGCGDARSRDELAAAAPFRWVGVDIPDSPESLRAERRTGIPMAFFDGINLPIASSSIDLVYSRQVFEHVRHPQPLLAEVWRALRPGGMLIGSTSHLEPFHSRSVWNFTPYGFARLLEDAGFASVTTRPGTDAFSLIARRLLSYARIRIDGQRIEARSPFNSALDVVGRIARVNVQRLAALKLVFSGHFVFTACRPS